MSAPIRAILFDLGNTVIQFGEVDRTILFRRAVRRTYMMWARRNRRMPDLRRYYLHQWFAVRWGYLKRMLLRREMDSMHYIHRACRKLWLTAPEAFFEDLVWNWYKPLADVATIEPGTADMLEQLRNFGYHLGIVSKTFVPGFVLDRHLTELGLISFFPHRVYSSDVGYRKPQRQIFELALRHLEVEPDQAVFVGDSFHDDVGGARRAGMYSVWKRPAGLRHNGGTNASAVIDRLTDLPGAITQLNGTPPTNNPLRPEYSS